MPRSRKRGVQHRDPTLPCYMIALGGSDLLCGTVRLIKHRLIDTDLPLRMPNKQSKCARPGSRETGIMAIASAMVGDTASSPPAAAPAGVSRDNTKTYFPLAGQATDGSSNEDEAAAPCFCGAVQLAIINLS